MGAPKDDRGTTGVLVLRAWAETGDRADIRVRVLVATPDAATTVLAEVVGADAVCDVVSQWLDRLADTGRPHR